MNELVLNNVSKQIKNNDILKDISFTFKGGNIYGVYGHNGSGKTMLFRAMSGLIKPSSGSILINKKLLHKEIDFPESLGILIENPVFWPSYTGLEVLETLSLIKKVAKRADLCNALERVGLDPSSRKPVKKYSLGMKQRLGIAQAIMEKPDIIILDEPTNALDESGVSLIYKLLLEEKERGSIVVISSHHKEDLEQVCDVKIQMQHGTLV